MRKTTLPAGWNRALSIAMAVLTGACTAPQGSSDVSTPARPPSDPIPSTTTSAPEGPRSAPRWEPVGSFHGQGSADSDPFAIAADVIQWRVHASCVAGAVRIESVPAPTRPVALVDDACPGPHEGYSIVTGDVRLRVQATGPWTVVVEQQVDSPLAEAPLPEMDAGEVVAAGDVYGIERIGRGRATLYRLPDGTGALRLDDFEVSQNSDLFVWLSEAVEPRTSVEASRPPYVEIAELKSTLGSQNYQVPEGVDLDRVTSVVIWCAPVRIAYAAAALTGS